MGARRALRMIWYSCFVYHWYYLRAYRSEFVSLVLRVFISVFIYYFWGNSIEYQRGILDYGTDSPLGFMLSGVFLSEFMSFRWMLALHIRTFYHFYSRPIRPLLQILREWLAVSIDYVVPFRLVPCAVLLLATQRLNARPEAVLLFLSLSAMLCIGQHLVEVGATLVFKKEQPILFAFEALEELSGRAFPITILGPLQQVLLLYPPSWAYLVWRQVLFAGMHVAHPDFLVFASSSILMFVLGLAVFNAGCDKIYREGLVL